MQELEPVMLLKELRQLCDEGFLTEEIVLRETAFIRWLQEYDDDEETNEPKVTSSSACALGADLFATGALLPPTAALPMAPSVQMNASGRLIPGQILCQRYRILALLAAGGMGQVYLVFDLRRSRLIAIKRLHPTLQVKGFEQRLHQELAINESLTHPQILRTYDLEYEPEADFFFFTMEYVLGGSLEHHLQLLENSGPPFSVKDTFSILEQVGQALDYAHLQNVIHRDLKPANVLVQQKNKETPMIKLLDFGIASSSGLLGGKGVGTAYYMAPEQLRGESLSFQTDLYALGVISFQLLTGYLPQPGMPNPSVLLKTLPSAIDPVLSRSMHWQSQDRFCSAFHFIEALSDALGGSLTPSTAKNSELGSVGPRSRSAQIFSFPSSQTPNKPSSSKILPPDEKRRQNEVILGLEQTKGDLISLAMERDSAFSRLSKRIDHKRPPWLEQRIPRQAPRSVEVTAEVPLREDWALPVFADAPKGIRQRLLLSRRGLPLLVFSHISQGAFWMGLETSDDLRQMPKVSIVQEGYWISRVPVTNRIWSIFVEESGYQPSPKERKTYYLRHWKNGLPPEHLMDAPVVWVSFSNVWAFCDFYGLSLPTEAQWEKAARSTDERLYPWGNIEPKQEYGNFCGQQGGVCPVGMFEAGVSPFGLLDCAGNVFEWCADRWNAQLSRHDQPSTFPRKQTDRVTVRGGHYGSKAEQLCTTYRQGTPLMQSAAHTGFRPVLDWRK